MWHYFLTCLIAIIQCTRHRNHHCVSTRWCCYVPYNSHTTVTSHSNSLIDEVGRASISNTCIQEPGWYKIFILWPCLSLTYTKFLSILTHYTVSIIALTKSNDPIWIIHRIFETFIQKSYGWDKCRSEPSIKCKCSTSRRTLRINNQGITVCRACPNACILL